MLKIAAEVNLSETAFVVPKPNNHFDIRWFTPQVEVKLCGHATLAAAHVLWNELKMADEDTTVYFDSRSGVLPVTKHGTTITLNLPAFPVEPCAMPAGLAQAIDVSPIFIGMSEDDYLIELRSPEEVINLAPNIADLKNIECAGFIFTAECDKNKSYDFVSRYFAPREGIDEDPVTGSAHCKLAPFWAERLHKNTFTAYQSSKRGGVLGIEYNPDRVFISGQAVTAFSGRFLGVQDVLPIT